MTSFFHKICVSADQAQPASFHRCFGGIDVKVQRKSVRSVRLKVMPPRGEVRVTAPWYLGDDAIERFVLEHRDWIRKRQEMVARDAAGAQKAMGEGDLIPCLGLNYVLGLSTGTHEGFQQVPGRITLVLKPGSPPEKIPLLLNQWYRSQLEMVIPGLLNRWQPVLGVRASAVVYRNMKSRWGSCNVRTARICLALGLARKSLACVEYVVVHELVHLLEPSHNARFKALMTQFLPDWPQREKELRGMI